MTNDDTPTPRRRFAQRRRVALGGIAAGVLVAALAGGVAWAAIPDPGTLLIHGCYNTTTGALRVIDPTKGSCAAGEAALNWNQHGINWRGPWKSTTSYAVNDAVALNGSSYIAKVANTMAEPPGADWGVLASKGGAGPSGTISITQYTPSDAEQATGGWQFMGSPPQLTFADTHTAAQVSGSVDMASTDGTAATGVLGVCYQSTAASSPIVNVSEVEPDFVLQAESYVVQSVSGAVGNLTAGTYSVGLCLEYESTNMTQGLATATVTLSETQSGVTSSARPAVVPGEKGQQ